MAAVAEAGGLLVARFARERYDDVIGEILPLLEEHYLAVAHYQDIEFNPDWQRYAQADEVGRLRIYTARCGRGHLIGYAIYLVQTNVHYMQSLQAHQDVLFLLPEWRGGGVGNSLLETSERDLMAMGVQVVYQHIKAKDSRLLGRFLRTRGYEHVDEIYGKRLDKWA